MSLPVWMTTAPVVTLTADQTTFESYQITDANGHNISVDNFSSSGMTLPRNYKQLPGSSFAGNPNIIYVNIPQWILIATLGAMYYRSLA